MPRALVIWGGQTPAALFPREASAVEGRAIFEFFENLVAAAGSAALSASAGEGSVTSESLSESLFELLFESPFESLFELFERDTGSSALSASARVLFELFELFERDTGSAALSASNGPPTPILRGASASLPFLCSLPAIFPSREAMRACTPPTEVAA